MPMNRRVLKQSIGEFDSDCIFSFVDAIEEVESHIPFFWPFFRELMMFEEGYVRYDHDARNKNGLLHPLNHCDVFYSSNATFKIGLEKRISLEVFMDLLNLETNCQFLS